MTLSEINASPHRTAYASITSSLSPSLLTLQWLANTMQTEENDIISLLKDDNLTFITPVYQRPYSWQSKQCETLWQDLLDLQTGEHRYHFIGTIVLITDIEALGDERVCIIDGQQRITTLCLMLLAIRDYAKSLTPNNDDLSIDNLLYTKINGKRTPRIVLTDSDDTVFSALTNGESVSDTDSLIYRNYNLFCSSLKNACLEAQEQDSSGESGSSKEQMAVSFCRKLISTLKQLKIVKILLDRDDNPQRVFETLNSTGKPLKSADLIRNYILMSAGTDNELAVELRDSYWLPLEKMFEGEADFDDQLDGFFTESVRVEYWIHNLNKNKLQLTKLYNCFKTIFWPKEPHEDVLKHAKKLLLLGQCYANIMDFAKAEGEKDAELQSCFYDLRALSDRTLLPLILYLYYCYRNPQEVTAIERISKEELVSVYQSLISLLIRLLLTENNPNRKLADYIQNMLGSIGALASSNKANALDKFQRRFGSLEGCSSCVEIIKRCLAALVQDNVFPSDLAVENSLTHAALYGKNKSRSLDSFILTHLAVNRPTPNRSELEHYRTFTIEHIMPQTLKNSWRDEIAKWLSGTEQDRIHQEYVHLLGNLTLTTENSELGAKPFADKCDYYTKSNVVNLNQQVLESDHWDVEKIHRRGKLLISNALKLWPTADVSYFRPLVSKDNKGASGNTALTAKYTTASLATYSKDISLAETIAFLHKTILQSSEMTCNFIQPDLIEYSCNYRSVIVINAAPTLPYVKLILRQDYEQLKGDEKELWQPYCDFATWDFKGISTILKQKSDCDKITATLNGFIEQMHAYSGS